jgi:hypothetical protein
MNLKTAVQPRMDRMNTDSEEFSQTTPSTQRVNRFLVPYPYLSVFIRGFFAFNRGI